MRRMIHEGREVVYIEYIDNLPHEVLTAPIDSEWGLSWFDFEYIGNDKKAIEYYQCGGGGRKTEIQAPHFRKNSSASFWMAPGCKFKGKSKAKNCIQLEKPLRLKGWGGSSLNPFKVSWENPHGFEYCKICDAHYGHDEGCSDHHTWSDEHGCFVYEDGSKAD